MSNRPQPPSVRAKGRARGPHSPKKNPSRVSRVFADISAFLGRLFMPRRRPPSFVFSVAVTTIKLAFILVLIVGVSGVGAVIGVAKAYAETIPNLDVDKLTDHSLSSFIYDRNGALLTTYRGTENRILTSYAEMPENLVNAFVAVEDARFFTHNGVDIKRIAGAFVNNMRNDSMQGGSTITQQLIKLQLLSMEQTYKRKIQEAYMALEVEKLYSSKEQILEIYLNTIWLGESNYGVVAAANDYFGKNLSELSLRECATLAGITRNPTRYNPRRCVYTTNTPEASVDRTNYVLSTMYENNFITRDEYNEALGEMPAIKRRFAIHEISEETYRSLLKSNMLVLEKATVTSLYDMPSAVESVLADVEDTFMRMRGLEMNKENRTAVRREIQSGGYHIYSTIDPKIQKIAEDVTYNWEDYPPMKDGSTFKRDVSSSGIIQDVLQPQVAVSIFDYVSGEIVAVIGSRTPPAGLLEYNRARASTMPVGSSIKPIAVYGPALDMGNSPASVTVNMPIPIEGWNTDKGYPSNSTRGDFKGIITFRRALNNSLNTAAANTLMDYIGINDSKNYLISLGVNPDHILADGFGLSLGSSGITPMEMSVAFGTIANSGTYQQPLTFTKVTDSLGNVILDMKAEQQDNKRQVFRKGTSWMLTDMLVDAVQRGICYNAKIDGMTIGGKTGTHSNYVGVSFSGFSPYYSCSVWIGADESKPLGNNASGNNYAAPLWQTIMARVHDELALENRPIIADEPETLGLTKATTCSLTGKLATDACQADINFPPVTDWWHSDSVPTEPCDSHVMATFCMDSNKIADFYCQNTLRRSIALLPAGNRAEQLPLDQRETLLPGVIPGIPEHLFADTLYSDREGILSALRYDPAFIEHFCPLHTMDISPTDPSAPYIPGDPGSVG